MVVRLTGKGQEVRILYWQDTAISEFRESACEALTAVCRRSY